MIEDTTPECSLSRRRGAASWKAILAWAVAVLLVAAAVYGLVLASRSNTPGNSGNVNLAPVSASDWVQGDRSAAITLMEYADFQCPACGTYYPIVKQVIEKYGNRMLYVYRDFPLTQIHAHAQLAAEAAEAAGLQGKFWEMFDQLFTHQNDWAEATNAQMQMESYAKTIGIDTTRWKNALTSTAVAQKINNDVASGTVALVDATPTFFLNGKPLNVDASVSSFTTAIDAALTQGVINHNTNTANGSTTNTNS